MSIRLVSIRTNYDYYMAPSLKIRNDPLNRRHQAQTVKRLGVQAQVDAAYRSIGRLRADPNHIKTASTTGQSNKLHLLGNFGSRLV